MLCIPYPYTSPLPLWPSFLSRAARAFRVFMSGFSTFTPEQIAAAPQLAPSFDMTLRAADISEEVITGFRVHKDCRDICCDGYYRGRTRRNSSRSIWRRHCKVRFTSQGVVGKHSQRLAFSEGKSRGEIEGGRGCSYSRAAYPMAGRP